MTAQGLRLVRRRDPDCSHDGQQLRDYLAAQAAEDLSERRRLLQAALAGNERAKALVLERWPSLRWWREGRWVVGGPSGNAS